jgi:hypothetical protein
MSQGGRRVAAVILCALSWAALFTSAIIWLQSWGERDDADLLTGLMLMAAVFVYPAVGTVIVSRQGDNPIGWILCIGGFALAVQTLSSLHVDHTQVYDLGHLPGEGIVTWLSSWTGWLGFGPIVTFLLLLFPTGRLLSRRWRYAGWLAGVSIALGAIGQAFAFGPLEDYPAIANPFGMAGTAGELFGVMRDVSWLVLFVSVLTSSIALVVRFRRSRGDERQQMKWLLLSGALFAAAILAWFVLEFVGGVEFAQLLWTIAVGSVPISVGIAILKYRLYDIDVVINRTLVYGTLTASLALAYLGFVLVLRGLLTPITPESDLAVAGSTIAVAALFRPLRARIQALIDRRFYRSKYDAVQTLERFSASLRDEVDLATLRADLLGVVQDTMQPAHTSLWLRTAEEPR